jgi:hypothetical protein
MIEAAAVALGQIPALSIMYYDTFPHDVVWAALSITVVHVEGKPPAHSRTQRQSKFLQVLDRAAAL